VSRPQSSQGAPRARPVADAPVAALLERIEELSRRWAIAMLRERPLAALGEVPLERLALLAPGLCTKLVQALAAEREPAALDELQTLASDWDAADIVANLEALRGVVWEATLEQLRDPSARQVAELGDRLAFLCAELARVALTGARSQVQAPHAPAPLDRAQVLYSAPGRSGAVLVDEHEDAPEAPRQVGESHRSRPGVGSARQANPAASGPSAAGRPLPWDTPLQPPAADSDVPPSVDGQGRESELRITRRRGASVDRRA
jgi:hypothetical protein